MHTLVHNMGEVLTKIEIEISKLEKTRYFEGGFSWIEFKIKTIPYRVSNNGEIQTRLISAGKNFYNFGNWRKKTPFKQSTDKYGGYYLCTCVGSKHIRVHRLVAICFIGAIEKGLEVNHIDGFRENNSIENIEITTHLKNMRNMSERRPEKNPNYKGKVSESVMRDILERISKGETNKYISGLYKIDPSNISKIRHGHWFKKYPGSNNLKKN